jgi:hypothetical protein
MAHLTTHAPAVQTAVELPAARRAASVEAHLQAQGLLPGAGPVITPRTQQVDQLMVKHSRCPACRQRGRQYKPFHGRDRQTGRPRYVIVAACACGAGEVM